MKTFLCIFSTIILYSTFTTLVAQTSTDNITGLLAYQQTTSSQALQDNLDDVNNNPNFNTYISSTNYIFFDFDRANLRSDARKILDNYIDILKKNRAWKIEIVGYTDNMGSEIYNKYISGKRAEAAASYLAQRGVGKYRILIKSKGYICRMGHMETVQIRQSERRCEIKLIK